MDKDTTNLNQRQKNHFIEITDQMAELLTHEYENNPSQKIRRKCHALLLRAKWPSKKDKTIWTISEICHILNVNEKTVDRWIAEFNNCNLNDFLKLKYKQQKGKLDEVKEQLCNDLNNEIFITTDHIIDHIRNKYNISIHRTQLRQFLHRNNFSWCMTGHIPGKADPEKQKEWISNTLNPALEDCEKGDSHLYFSDAVHFVLSHFGTHVWSQTRRFLKSSTGRNRINVLGAVNALTLAIVTTYNTTYIDAHVVVAFLNKLRLLHPDNNTIYYVLDNARYQHCKYVMDIAKSLNIELLFLPPYSPNLNIIERLWKFTKRKVLYGKYFENPQIFHKTIVDFFDTVNDKYKDDLKTLLTLNFQNLSC